MAVWQISPGTSHVKGGSMTVDHAGRVHVLVRGENGSPANLRRDPATGKWTREKASVLGSPVARPGGNLYVVLDDGLQRTSASRFGTMETLVQGQIALFKDSHMGTDRTRVSYCGWVSVIGQNGKTVTVVDYWVGN